MSKSIKRFKAKCTEITYRLLKKIIQTKIGIYPYKVYLKRQQLLPYQTSIALSSLELRINRIISNASLASKKD